MKTHLAFILTFSILCSAFAQEQKAGTATEVKTKIEAFEAKTGAVIVRGISTIGSVRGQFAHGQFTTGASVECREFTDASSSKKERGIVIVVKEGVEAARESSSYIDYDEIDSLLKGIDYLAAINKSVTKLDSFQADYKTRGDFTVSTYSVREGIAASLTSGWFRSTRAVLTLDDLAEFRNLIQTAKAKLDSIRQ